MNTLAGLAGPAITVYAQAAKLPHAIYAATLQPIFMAAGLLSVGVKLSTGAANFSGVSLWVWPAAALGAFVVMQAGKRILRHVSRDVAHLWALALAVVGAVIVLTRGVIALV